MSKSSVHTYKPYEISFALRANLVIQADISLGVLLADLEEFMTIIPAFRQNRLICQPKRQDAIKVEPNQTSLTQPDCHGAVGL